jgi:hypothetical protein
MQPEGNAAIAERRDVQGEELSRKMVRRVGRSIDDLKM